MVDKVDGIGVKMENDASAFDVNFLAFNVVKSTWIAFVVITISRSDTDVLDAFVDKRKFVSV